MTFDRPVNEVIIRHINAFQSTFGGLDSNELLLLLTYGLVPLAVIMTSMMITMAYGKAQ